MLLTLHLKFVLAKANITDFHLTRRGINHFNLTANELTSAVVERSNKDYTYKDRVTRCHFILKVWIYNLNPWLALFLRPVSICLCANFVQAMRVWESVAGQALHTLAMFTCISTSSCLTLRKPFTKPFVCLLYDVWLVKNEIFQNKIIKVLAPSSNVQFRWFGKHPHVLLMAMTIGKRK